MLLSAVVYDFSEWVADFIGHMARNVEPAIIQLDDDFRLHNHGAGINCGKTRIAMPPIGRGKPLGSSRSHVLHV